MLCTEWRGVIHSVLLDGATKLSWRAHQGAPTSLSITPDGNRIITAGADGMVRVFDRSFDGDWESTITLVGDHDSLLGACYVGDTGAKPCESNSGLAAEDQGVAIAVTQHGSIIAWPLAAPSRFHERVVGSMSMSGDGLLYAGGVDDRQRAEVRDTSTGRTLAIVPGLTNNAPTALSPDGQHLYATEWTGPSILRSIDVRRGVCDWAVQAHEGFIESLDVSPDGLLLVTLADKSMAADDFSTIEAVRVWDARTGDLLCTLRTTDHKKWQRAMFGPDAGPVSRPVPGQRPSLTNRQLITASTSAEGAVSLWDLGRDAPPVTVKLNDDFLRLGFSTFTKHDNVPPASPPDDESAKLTNDLDPFAPRLLGFLFIDPGTGPRTWAMSAGHKELFARDVADPAKRVIIDTLPEHKVTNQTDATYVVHSLQRFPDGKAVIAKGSARINLLLPRLYRELSRNPSPVAQAEWYAEYGLWAWTRELLEREHAAGREVPALSMARANWMCGDYVAARGAFEQAVARREVPAGYAELCLAVGDTPPTIDLLPPKVRHSIGADPTEPVLGSPTTPLAASDSTALRERAGHDVVVEGDAIESLWSSTGKVMQIQFAGDKQNKLGLQCAILEVNRKKFDSAFAGDVADALGGARLRVRGKLTTFGGYNDIQGRPEIIVDEPQQVTILGRSELPAPLTRIGDQLSVAVDLNNSAWALATDPDEHERDPLKAVEQARQALELDPDCANVALNTLGVAYYRAGNWQAAIEWLESSMKFRKGGDSRDWFFLAMAQEQLGSHNEARKWFDQAVAWMEKRAPLDEQLLGFRHEAEELLNGKSAVEEKTAKPD